MNLTGRPPYQKATNAPTGTAAGRRHIARVKALPCVVCGRAGPYDAHHVIHDRLTVPRDDFRTIPLCKAHHQDGPDAIHNGKTTWAERYGMDFDYLPAVERQLKETDT